MLWDASKPLWGSALTKVPAAQDGGVAVCHIDHVPLGFPSGAFKGSQLQWAFVIKNIFANVRAFCLLEYLLWDGVDIY